MTDPPFTPAGSLAAIIRWLSLAVAGCGTRGALPLPVIAHIVNRLREINQRVARIALRVAAGRYRSRVVRAPPRRGVRHPRRPDPLPRRRGWLLQLAPEASVAVGQLDYLLRDPAMLDLMAAAPGSLARPLRSFCRMLGVEPPPVLALPARPRRPRPPRPAQPPRPPAGRPPPPPDLPAWLQDRRKPWSLARIRGSPKRG